MDLSGLMGMDTEEKQGHRKTVEGRGIVARSCVVCRGRGAVTDLIRFVLDRETGEIRCDLLRELSGRGVHLHPEVSCLGHSAALRAVRASFLRAWRRKRGKDKEGGERCEVRLEGGDSGYPGRSLPELVAEATEALRRRFPDVSRQSARVISALALGSKAERGCAEKG